MDKEINNNGYDYVDLGLPSGTLWATMNVGASKPSDAGLYFQWGDTQGYTKEQVGIGEGLKKFILGDYKWYLSGSPYDDSIKFKKYTVTGDILDLEDDAAHVNMKGDWHIPTPTQIQELINETTHLWTTQDGVNGMTFTSKKDESKFIFIPAAGFARDGSVRYSGDNGSIWPSMLDTDYAVYGQSLYFSSGDAYLYGSYYRCYGLSVRGVIDKNDDEPNDKKNDMNEKLNLVEILKDAPKGTKLWSPICGECEFVAVEDGLRPIHCTYKRNIITTQFDSYVETNIFFVNDESILFPSKDLDWSTFKFSKGHKHFEPYQKVLIKDKFMSKYLWVAALYSHFDASTNKHYLVGADWAEDDDIISYEGNEDKLGKLIQ